MTFLELQTELQNRLSIATTNTFWTTAMIKSWLNQAYRWTCNYKKWPFTEEAKKTTTVKDQYYYDYPVEFKADSISRLTVVDANGDEKSYKKIRFQDFLNHKEKHPDSEDKLFSDYRRQYFISPTPDVTDREITVWGQIKPNKLVNDSDITLFAEGEEMGEEAIIKRALMVALQKAKKYSEAAIEREESRLILEEIFARIQEEQASYRGKDNPLFDIPRFL